MAISQFRAKRKSSGGRYYRIVKKAKNRGNLPKLTVIGKVRKKIGKGRAGVIKIGLLGINSANVYSPKEKKYFQAKIEGVVESPSNRNFVIRNIMTKGTIIKTSKGNARVVSRPGQEGTVNAILI